MRPAPSAGRPTCSAPVVSVSSERVATGAHTFGAPPQLAEPVRSKKLTSNCKGTGNDGFGSVPLATTRRFGFADACARSKVAPTCVLKSRGHVIGEPEQPGEALRSKASIAPTPVLPMVLAKTRFPAMIGASPLVGAKRSARHSGWHSGSVPLQLLRPVASKARSWLPDVVKACPSATATSPAGDMPSKKMNEHVPAAQFVTPAASKTAIAVAVGI